METIPEMILPEALLADTKEHNCQALDLSAASLACLGDPLFPAAAPHITDPTAFSAVEMLMRRDVTIIVIRSVRNGNSADFSQLTENGQIPVHCAQAQLRIQASKIRVDPFSRWMIIAASQIVPDFFTLSAALVSCHIVSISIIVIITILL
jgi:hypothetical protein